MIYSITIAVILTVASLILKKSKVVSFLFFLFMWLMMGWNYYNGDYEAYKIRYEFNPAFSFNLINYEWGYNFIMSLFNAKDVSFQIFFVWIAFITLFILFLFVLKFSQYPAITLSCFFWIYLPLDFVLLRNFIAYIIIFVGFYFMFLEKKKSRTIFFICSLFATTIHISSFFYFIFLLTPHHYKLNIKKVSLFIILFFFLYMGIRQIIIASIGYDAIMRMENYESNMNMFILYTAFQILNIIIIRNYTRSNSIIQKISPTILYNINILMLFLVIFYFDMTIFVRIFKNISFINVLYIINYIPFHNKKFYNTLLLIFYLLFFYFTFIQPVKEDTIISLFKYNLIFN